MHALVEWKLYDTRGVHHVTSKDKEIFMLMEKDYPLRKGLALVMVSYKLQVENYSQMVNDLILKIYKIANSPRQQGIPTASYKSSHWQNKFPLPVKKDATARRKVKPLPGPPCHRTIVVDYFFNNDLEYLKTSNPEVNKFSKHNVYSTKAILGVKSVSVKKLHGYGHLEEIVVKRSDRQLYKFKEGDFVDLHLNDIVDMLLLAVQHKLFHLDDIDIVDFIVAPRMFTRSLIIKKRVEDLQLGVERIIYEDLNKQKSVMRADELYKFLDGTLKSVHNELHHRVLDFRLDYNTEMPTRK
nr:hypothetical protein [Tanacetum cinerariifolium]